MNNIQVLQKLDECESDIIVVCNLIKSIGFQSNIVPYLCKYAIIKSCGTIEVAFKTIISDHCSKRQKKQVQTFISKKVKDNSSNPTYENICRVLSDFDSDWNKQFKKDVKNHLDNTRIKLSLESLVEIRNEFAHGGNPNAGISDILKYYRDSRIYIEILDNIVS